MCDVNAGKARQVSVCVGIKNPVHGLALEEGTVQPNEERHGFVAHPVGHDDHGRRRGRAPGMSEMVVRHRIASRGPIGSIEV